MEPNVPRRGRGAASDREQEHGVGATPERETKRGLTNECIESDMDMQPRRRDGPTCGSCNIVIVRGMSRSGMRNFQV